jgi:ribosomal protein S18 acetylase RimI-like enzyme
MEILFRTYIDEEKDAILAILKLNTPKYFAEEEAKDLSYYLDHEKELYYVACYDKMIVGCGGINFEAKPFSAKISWDIIHPQYQGMSIGTKLLQYRLDILKHQYACQNISVRTSQHVYLFYEKNGFVLKQIVKDYWAVGFDLYEMVYEKSK